MAFKSDRMSQSDATNTELMDLAESSFKAVLDADYHLDDKASRILSTMAFLTAAAAAVFSKAYLPSNGCETESRKRAIGNRRDRFGVR